MSLVSNIGVNIRANNKTVEFKPAKIWLNIGFYHSTLKTKDGEPVLITLPLGIPVDTSKDASCSMNAPDNVQIATQCSNLLKAKIIAAAMDLEPGERLELKPNTGLKIFLQRANEQSEETETNVSQSAAAEIDTMIKL